MFAPVLDLLHAHGDSTKSLRLSSLVPFAIRTYFVSSVRKSASLTEVNLTVRGTKSVILNLFQDLSLPQSIPHPTLSYLGEGIQVYTKADC